MRAQWKRVRYRLEWLGLRLATRLIPLLSRKACFRLARVLGSLMSALDRRGRKVALSNLEVAFGDRLIDSPPGSSTLAGSPVHVARLPPAPLSILQRKKIVRESFQHFARTTLDLLWSPRLTRENFSSYIELENFEETARDTGSERSVIIACYHYSNFEWLSLACGFRGLTGTIITQEFKNSLLDPIFKNIREQSGHEMIPRDRGIVRLYKVLRRKGRTALLVDLTIPPSLGAVAIDCFGLKTSVTSAHAWLQKQTGAAIIPAHCEPLPDGRYRLIFHPKIENTEAMSLQQIAQACWNSFEPYVRKNPAPWLWMYKHWRYRPRNADRPYPFYADIGGGFNKLLRGDSPGGPLVD